MRERWEKYMAGDYEHQRHFDGFADAVTTSLYDDTRARSPIVAPTTQSVKPDNKRPLICVTPRWMPGHDQFTASQSVGDVQMEAITHQGQRPHPSLRRDV